MSDKELPDPGPVLDLLNAFRCSAALFAGVSLGVFDRLALEALDLPTLARHLGADQDALGRLLAACGGRGLLARRGEAYACTPAAATYLSRTSPRRMTGYITYSDR